MTLFLSFRYQPVGGSTRPDPVAWDSTAGFALKPFDVAKIRSRVAERDVLIAIGGYNNSEPQAARSLSRLEATLNLPATALFIGVFWPGDSAFGSISYPTEKLTAGRTGRFLGTYCNRELLSASSLSFVSHSLGARVVLETIRKLDRRARSACLAAAAIERTCLEKEYADAFAKTDRISVLASKRDAVLRLAFPFGNVVGHILDPSANPLSDALGYAGPPRPVGKTTRPWQISDEGGYGHGDYFPPSGIGAVFPDAAAKWNKPCDFFRRAFAMQPPGWPE